MQLPAEQTSREPQPRRGKQQARRRPFVSQNTPGNEATAADSRANPPLLSASGSQIHRPKKVTKQVAESERLCNWPAVGTLVYRFP